MFDWTDRFNFFFEKKIVIVGGIKSPVHLHQELLQKLGIPFRT